MQLAIRPRTPELWPAHLRICSERMAFATGDFATKLDPWHDAARSVVTPALPAFKHPQQAIIMTITISRLTPALGAIVEGITLADELPQQSIDRLGELLVEHQILFLDRKPLTPQQQCRFAKHFGELLIHPIYPMLPELPEIMVIDTHAGFLPDSAH